MVSCERMSGENAFISVHRTSSSGLRAREAKLMKPPTSLCTAAKPEKPRLKVAGITHGIP